MEKTIRESYTELAQIMLIHQANPAGNIHGGEIMKLMDNAAFVAAFKHAGSSVVTARVDEIEFIRPIRVGDVVTCTAYLAFAGKSSMEVKVLVEVQSLSNGEPRKTALSGFFTMVALDEQRKTITVPRLRLETDEERALFEEGQKRYAYYKRKKIGRAHV